MIQAHYVYCTLYFYYYYISFTSEHQALDLGGWGPWLLGISSRSYGGGKVPPSAVCKLEIQESGGVMTSEFEDLKTRVVKDRRSMVSSRNQVKGWILPSSTFSLYWSSHWAGWWPLLFGRANFTDSEQTKSTDSNVNFNWKYPHRHNQK